MKHILLIIKKDLSRYWLIVLCTMLAFSFHLFVFYLFASPHQSSENLTVPQDIADFVRMVFWLVFAMALVPSVMQEDNLCDDNAFLLTRPLGRKTIIWAKLSVLILLGIILPVCGEMLILSQFESMALYWPQVLVELLLRATAFVLMCVALAAYSKSIGHYIALLIPTLTAIHFLSSPDLARAVTGSDAAVIVVSASFVLWSMFALWLVPRMRSKLVKAIVPFSLLLVLIPIPALNAFDQINAFVSSLGSGAEHSSRMFDGNPSIKPSLVDTTLDGPITSTIEGRKVEQKTMKLRFAQNGDYCFQMFSGHIDINGEPMEADAGTLHSYVVKDSLLDPEPIRKLASQTDSIGDLTLKHVRNMFSEMWFVPKDEDIASIVSLRTANVKGEGLFEVFKIEKIFEVDNASSIAYDISPQRTLEVAKKGNLHMGMGLTEKFMEPLFTAGMENQYEVDPLMQHVYGEDLPTAKEPKSYLVVLEVIDAGNRLLIDAPIPDTTAKNLGALWPRSILKKRIWTSRNDKSISDLYEDDPDAFASKFLGVRLTYVGNYNAAFESEACEVKGQGK